MDSNFYSNTEFSSPMFINDPGCSPYAGANPGQLVIAGGAFTSNVEMQHNAISISDPTSSYAGAFFPRSRHLVVNGGTFTSNVANHTHHAAPTAPGDFRRIPWGDIDLIREIRFNSESKVATRQSQGPSVRRMYSAKIEGREAGMTVAVYEGETAEEQWQRDISKHSRLRHPNILQIFAAASSTGIHAIVAHGDLMHFQDYINCHRHLPISSAYIHGRADAEYYDTRIYLERLFQRAPSNADITFWIRRSTGRLCIELARRAGDPFTSFIGGFQSTFENAGSLNDVTNEANVIASWKLSQYHKSCYLYQSEDQTWTIISEQEVKLGAVICLESHEVEIASLTYLGWYSHGWGDGWSFGNVTESGWARYEASNAFDNSIFCSVSLDPRESWISQANHIFARLQITSNYEKYGVVTYISFQLEIRAPTQNPPTGYLFLCPKEQFRTGPTSFRWPDCPAYWSLDPSGVQRLSTEQATHLGFPPVQLITKVFPSSWDASTYAGLRKFHKGKGFDPESQDVARHCGHPLYQISNQKDMPFAHVTEDFSDEEENDYSDNAHVASSEELHGSTSHPDGYEVEPGNQVQAERPSDGVWSIQNNPNFGSPDLVGPLASASMQGPYSSDRSFDLPRPAFPQHVSLPYYDGNMFWGPGSNFDASATHVDYFPLPTNSDASFDFGGNSSQQLSTFFLPNSSRPDTTDVDFFPSPTFEVTSPFSSAPGTSYTWPQLLPSQPDAASEQQMAPAIQTVPRLDHKESPTAQKRPAEELDSERPSKRARG